MELAPLMPVAIICNAGHRAATRARVAMLLENME